MNNQDIFVEANKALAEGEYEKFITYCAEDIKWINVGGSAFNGKAETLKYISSAYDDLTFTTENHITEKDIVVEFGQITFEKNGDTKESSYCDIWKFENGMITHVKSFVI